MAKTTRQSVQSILQNEDDSPFVEQESVCGIVFRRSIRASLVNFSLALLPQNDDDDDDDDGNEEEALETTANDEGGDGDDGDGDEDDAIETVLVVMEFPMSQQQQLPLNETQPSTPSLLIIPAPSIENCQNSEQQQQQQSVTTTTQLQKQLQSFVRSSFRKCCTLGDLIVIRGGQWIQVPTSTTTTITSEQQPQPLEEISSCYNNNNNDKSSNSDIKVGKRCYTVTLPLNLPPQPSSSSLLPLGAAALVEEYLQVKQPKRWTIQQCQQAAAASWHTLRNADGNNVDSLHNALPPTTPSLLSLRIPRIISTRYGVGLSQKGQQQRRRQKRRSDSPCPPCLRSIHSSVTSTNVGTVNDPHDNHRDDDAEEERQKTKLHRGGGVVVLAKRVQGEYLTNFLIHMISHKLQQQLPEQHSWTTPTFQSDPSVWHMRTTVAAATTTTTTASSLDNPCLSLQDAAAAVTFLNQGAGVLDVAGGSGHVSMALCLMGISSTIVDPRAHIGKLPRRDRKYFAKQQQLQLHQQQQQKCQQESYSQEPCQPPNIVGGGDDPSLLPPTSQQQDSNAKSHRTRHERDTDSNLEIDSINDTELSLPLEAQPTQSLVEFKAFRAWFGIPPPRMELHHRGECMEVCSIDHELVRHCTALVALHPDEATEAIVDVAVQLRKPFCVVPCCVFARWYPNRRLRNQSPVFTYQDLLNYLQEKDESIQRSVLPFEGANTILWSTF